MKLQKLVTLVAAVLFLAVTSMAFAENQISVGSNSQPIPYGTDANNCNKGGDLSFQYRPTAVAGVTTTAGDAFTMDLDYGTSLCRKVDLWLKVPALVLNGSGANDIFSWNNATTDGAQLYIRVFGSVGDRRVNVRFHTEGGAAGNFTVNDLIDNMFLFRVFNQKTLPGNAASADGALKAGNGTAEISTAIFNALGNATEADNTLCVQHTPAQIAENEKINFNLNRASSSPNVFEFVGGQGAEPQIGHFISRTYSLVTCDKAGAGRIDCGSYEAQKESSCKDFDFEEGIGYCETSKDKELVIQANPTFDEAKDYYVDITILVNGAPGDNGVYFAAKEDVKYRVGVTKADVCGKPAETTLSLGENRWFKHGDITGSTEFEGDDVNTCLPAASKEFVKMSSTYGDLGFKGTHSYLKIDLPAFRYNLDKITAGDVVSVKVELRRKPCVLVTTVEKTIGTLCCDQPAATTATTLVYPYFTNMSGDAWWDGLVVTNLSSAAGTAALSFYEQDGDMGTYTTPTIAAYSMYVTTLEALLPAVTPAVGNTGALGNSRLWIQGKTAFSADGFAMMGEPTSGQSMGYLPRVSYKSN